MTTAHGIQSAAWLLIALPLLSSAVLLLLGKRADKWGHLLGAAVPVVLFVYAVFLFFSVKGESGENREITLKMFTWIPVGGFHVDAGLLIDPLSLCFVLLITGVGVADPHLRRRLHGARPRTPPLLRLLQLLHRRDAAARPREQLPRSLRRLGGRRSRVLPADQLLLRPQHRGHRRQQGVLRQPGRGRRAVDRDHADVRLRRQHVLRGRAGRAAERRRRRRDLADAAARRVRQVRSVPAADLAAGRDGGPDAGVGADPRRHDGHRRRLPDRALGADLRPVAGRAHRRRDHRCDHAALRLHLRLRAGRPEAGARQLDRQPDRLHVPRRRARPGRLRDRHHPPAGPRLLQGRAVPLGRFGHARDERPHRHAALRRPGPRHADHLRRVRVRLPRDHRLPRRHRVLHQGQDHRGSVRQGRHVRLDPRAVRPARRGHHRVLHDARAGDDFPRQEALGGRRPPARGAHGA